MLKCATCHETKEESNFRKRSYIKSRGYQYNCKDCAKKYDKKFYKNRSKEKLNKKYLLNKQIQERNKKFIYNYLLEHPCIQCGESNPVVLDFDHLSNKNHNIANMMPWSLKKITAEINKCQILCSNCHRKKTAKYFNWYKHKQYGSSNHI